MRFPALSSLVGRRDDGERGYVESIRSEDVEVVEPRALASIEGAGRPEPSGGSSGKDGSGSWYADVVEGGPDVNPELVGRAKFEIYREMKMTDAAVKSLLWLYKLPIRQADWGVAPSKKDPDGPAVAKARADWLAALTGLEEHGSPLMAVGWDDWLQQTLQFFEWGSMGEEIIWPFVGRRAVLTPWTDADGDTHLLRAPVRPAPRYPATVIEVKRDAQTGAVQSVLQDVPGAQPIPGRKLLWYATEAEGESIFGTSLLRSAYGPYRLKRSLIVSSAIGWDRFAAKFPVVRHPPGAEAKKDAERIGENVRAHERASVALEGPPPEYGGQWDIKLEGPDNFADPVNLLRFYNQEIAMSGLQQFSGLGTSERGSRAVGDVLSDPFYMAVTAFAGYVATERMRQFVRRVWDVNFGPQVPIPAVTVQKIQGRNVAVLARALADFSTAGLTFTDRDTQNDVRDQLDLRHLPELAAVVEGLPEDVGVAPAEGGPIAPVAAGAAGA